MLAMGWKDGQVSDVGVGSLCTKVSLYAQGNAGHQGRHNFLPVKGKGWGNRQAGEQPFLRCFFG